MRAYPNHITIQDRHCFDRSRTNHRFINLFRRLGYVCVRKYQISASQVHYQITNTSGENVARTPVSVNKAIEHRHDSGMGRSVGYIAGTEIAKEHQHLPGRYSTDRVEREYEDRQKLRHDKRRRKIERTNTCLGKFHCVLVRHDHLLTVYLAFLPLACLWITLPACF